MQSAVCSVMSTSTTKDCRLPPATGGQREAEAEPTNTGGSSLLNLLIGEDDAPAGLSCAVIGSSATAQSGASIAFGGQRRPSWTSFLLAA